MPTLTIKNVPQDLYKRLKTRAAQNRRSLNGEAIVCLEQALRSAPVVLAAMLASAREARRLAEKCWLTDDELQRAIDEGRP